MRVVEVLRHCRFLCAPRRGRLTAEGLGSSNRVQLMKRRRALPCGFRVNDRLPDAGSRRGASALAALDGASAPREDRCVWSSVGPLFFAWGV